MQHSRTGLFASPRLFSLIIVAAVSAAMIALPLDIRTTVSRIGTLSLLYPFSEMDKLLLRIDSTFQANRELNRRLDSLSVVVNTLIENRNENQRLRRMLDYDIALPFHVVSAEAASLSFPPPYKSMVIDIGQEKNVSANMGVITPDGVVGKTIATGWKSTTVQLLYDPACRVAARIQSSRAHGIIAYTGGRFLSMKDVPVEEQAAEGDSVVTSGLGGIFPEGLFIGTIVQTGETEGGLFRDILIMPGANFYALDEVFVINSIPAKTP